MSKTINLGDRVKHTITPYCGIVVANSEYLKGCNRLAVQAEELTKEGAVRDAVWFDELELEVVESGVHGRQAAVEKENGGPRPDAPI